jgi:hypothetical protein
MLNTISWSEYWTTMGVGLVVYYGYVGVKFFPRELARMRLGRRERGNKEEEDWEEEEEKPEEENRFGEEEAVGESDEQAGEKDRPARPEGLLKQGPEDVWRRRPGRRVWKQQGGEERRERGDPPPGKQPPVGGKERSLFSIAQTLAQEIKGLMARAAKEGMVKEELRFALQELLSGCDYQRLRETGFRQAINNLIQFDVENQCSFRFDAEEVNGLWIR